MRRQRSLRSTNWTPVPSQSKQGDCMFLGQCSWEHTSPSPRSSSKEHASSSSQRSFFPWSLPNSFTENSSCSYQPYPNRLECWPGSKHSLQPTQLFTVSPLILKMSFKLTSGNQLPKTLNSVAAQPKPERSPVMKADVSHLSTAQHTF